MPSRDWQPWTAVDKRYSTLVKVAHFQRPSPVYPTLSLEQHQVCTPSLMAQNKESTRPVHTVQPLENGLPIRIKVGHLHQSSQINPSLSSDQPQDCTSSLTVRQRESPKSVLTLHSLENGQCHSDKNACPVHSRKNNLKLQLPSNLPAWTERNWIYVAIRRSGQKKLDMPSRNAEEAQTLILEATTDDSQQVRDALWEQFSVVMTEVETRRSRLISSRRPKGDLKNKEPIPWLIWTTSTGKQGQTRNQANFARIWEEVVDVPMRKGVSKYQITSTLLPSSDDASSVSSDQSVDGGANIYWNLRTPNGGAAMTCP